MSHATPHSTTAHPSHVSVMSIVDFGDTVSASLPMKTGAGTSPSPTVEDENGQSERHGAKLGRDRPRYDKVDPRSAGKEEQTPCHAWVGGCVRCVSVDVRPCDCASVRCVRE